MENSQHFIEDNLLILSKQTMDLFLKQEDPGRCIALYLFYYYTAKWQKTNQPKVSLSYVASALHWRRANVLAIKKILVSIGLITEIRHTDPTTKQVKGWYIKLNYLWKKETITHSIPMDTLGAPIQNEAKSHSIPNPQGGNGNSNTLSVNKLNALNDLHANSRENSSVKKYERLPEEKRSTYHRIAYCLEDALHTQLVNYPKQFKAIKMMLQAGYTEAQICFAIKYMTNDQFYRDKGFDLMTVANSIARIKASVRKGVAAREPAE